MTTTNSEAAPVDLGAPTPSGDRCDPSLTRDQENTIMTQATNATEAIAAGYAADRYERLRNACLILAEDSSLNSDDNFVTGEMLMIFVEECTEQKILDGLTENDANTVGLLAPLDFIRGPGRMAERIVEWGDGKNCGREDDNFWGVVAALAAALKIALDAFAYSAREEQK